MFRSLFAFQLSRTFNAEYIQTPGRRIQRAMPSYYRHSCNPPFPLFRNVCLAWIFCYWFTFSFFIGTILPPRYHCGWADTMAPTRFPRSYPLLSCEVVRRWSLLDCLLISSACVYPLIIRGQLPSILWGLKFSMNIWLFVHFEYGGPLMAVSQRSFPFGCNFSPIYWMEYILLSTWLFKPVTVSSSGQIHRVRFHEQTFARIFSGLSGLNPADPTTPFPHHKSHTWRVVPRRDLHH